MANVAGGGGPRKPTNRALLPTGGKGPVSPRTQKKLSLKGEGGRGPNSYRPDLRIPYGGRGPEIYRPTNYDVMPTGGRGPAITPKPPKFKPQVRLDPSQVTDKRLQTVKRRGPQLDAPNRWPGQVVAEIPAAVKMFIPKVLGDIAMLGQNTDSNKTARLKPQKPPVPRPGPAPTTKPKANRRVGGY